MDEARQRRAEQRRQEALAAARRAAETAKRDLAAAAQRHEAGRRILDEAKEHAEDARLRVVALGEELRRAEEDRRAALSNIREAQDQLRQTQRAFELARKKADDAAAHVIYLSTED